MLPQPPPDAPAPPATEAALVSRRKWKWLWMVGLGSMVAVVASPLFLMRRRSCHSPAREATNNARQLGLALFEFETEYGKFPNATTILPVQQATGTALPMGIKTSNDFFRQLIAAGIAQSEPMFYAEISGNRKPDNIFDVGHALEKGECGFTYFLSATGDAAGNPGRPIVVAPMIPGTDQFDPKPFEGKAVLLKMDNSVTSLPIDKDGHVIVDGRNLMDPHHPIWDGHAPVIAWPDL